MMMAILRMEKFWNSFFHSVSPNVRQTKKHLLLPQAQGPWSALARMAKNGDGIHATN
jgi:hypothetical protein